MTYDETPPVYKLVTDVADLWQDDIVIIASSPEFSHAMSTTQNKTNRPAVAVDIHDGLITEVAPEVALFRVSIINDRYRFYSVNGLAVGTGVQYSSIGSLTSATTTYNELKTATTETQQIAAAAQAAVTIDPDGAALVKFDGTGARKYMRFNQDENLFSCYQDPAANSSVYFYVLKKPVEYDPQVSVAKLSVGGPVGSIRQLDLGVAHPEITFTVGDPDVASISADGLLTALSIGSTAVTASWPGSMEWRGGSVTFPLTVVDYNLAAPTLTIGQDFFTLADPNAEGSKLYYSISQSADAPTAWTEYAGEVPFQGEHGKFYVHAVAKSTIADLYGDSPIAEGFYYVANLDFGEYVLLTDLSQLRTDDLIVFATNGEYQKAISSIQDKNNRRATDVEIWRNDYLVDPSAEVGTFRVAKSGEGAAARYSFYGTNGPAGYLQATSSTYNLLQTGKSAKGCPAAITIDSDGLATVKFNSFTRCYMGFYTNGTNAFSFACYDSPRVEPLSIYVWRQRLEYDAPFADVELGLTDSRQFALGATHPDIAYSYADGSVASIDANGLLTPAALGSTAITASWPASDQWKAGSVTFTATVKNPAPTPDNLPDGNYKDSVTLTFDPVEGCDIYYITNLTPEPIDESDVNSWTKLEGNSLTIDSETYGSDPWVKVVYVKDDDFDSAVSTLEYSLDYKVYPPVVTEADGIVNVTLDPRNSDLEGYTIRYIIDKDPAVFGSDPELGTTLPLSLDPAIYGFRPTITVWIEDAQGNRVSSTTQTLALDGNAVAEVASLQDLDPQGVEFITLPSGEQVSATVYIIGAAVHTFHKANGDLYVTDNSTTGRSCIRLQGAPASVDHTKEIQDLTGRLAMQTTDNGVIKLSLLYLAHEDGLNDAEPQYREVSMTQLMDDTTLDHHYMLLSSVTYDANRGTISADGNTIYDIDDANASLGTSGTYHLLGYPSYTNEGMKFVALDANNVTMQTTAIDELTPAEPTAEFYTISGIKVANPGRGIYLMRTPAATKTIRK